VENKEENKSDLSNEIININIQKSVRKQNLMKEKQDLFEDSVPILPIHIPSSDEK
jgi:hypothetical protein